jgi:hypothetical protein
MHGPDFGAKMWRFQIAPVGFAQVGSQEAAFSWCDGMFRFSTKAFFH